MSDVSLSIDQIEYPLTVVDGTSLTLVLSGPQGPAGGESGGGSWGSITGDLVDQEDLALALAAKVPTTRTIAGHPLSSNVTLVSADISDASQTWLAGSLSVYGWGGITVATDYTSLDGYYAPQAIQNGKPSFGDGEFTDVGAWRSLGYSGGVWTIISYLDGTQLGYFTGEGEWPSEVVTWSPESGAIGSVVTSVTAVDRRLAGFTLPAGAGTLALTSDLSGYLTTSTAASTYVPTSRTIAGKALSSNITLVSADISDASSTPVADVLVKYDSMLKIEAENFVGDGIDVYTYTGIDTTTGFTYKLSATNLITVDRNYSPPNADGTLALTASATGIPDALHNATISGTVTFSGTGQANMQAAIGTFMDAEIVSGTSTDPGLPTPEQLKLAAETHGGGITGTGAVDNAILRADGVGGITLQNSDITISDATVTTQANVAIVNAHSGQTNSALVLTPLGTGAFIVGPKPDGTATGGNARGTNAIDIQKYRTAAAKVATADSSVIVGNDCVVTAVGGSVAIGLTASATGGNNGRCIAIGRLATASGEYSIAIGTATAGNSGSIAISTEGGNSSGAGAVLIGPASTGVSGTSSIGIGAGVATSRSNEISIGCRPTGYGDSRFNGFQLFAKTTNNTATALQLTNIFSSTIFATRANTIMSGLLQVVGTLSDGSAIASYKRLITFKNVGGVITLLQSENIGTDYEDNPLTALTITNTSPFIAVTGITGQTWRWMGVWFPNIEIAYGT